MPTLFLEVQTAMQASVVHRDGAAVAAMLAAHVGADRLDIYRNTFVHADQGAAALLSFLQLNGLSARNFSRVLPRIFIAAHPPRAAWLDRYGGEFAGFLHVFPQTVVAGLSQ